MNGCAPGLALIERLKATWKWAIIATILICQIKVLDCCIAPTGNYLRMKTSTSTQTCKNTSDLGLQ